MLVGPIVFSGCGAEPKHRITGTGPVMTGERAAYVRPVRRHEARGQSGGVVLFRA